MTSEERSEASTASPLTFEMFDILLKRQEEFILFQINASLARMKESLDGQILDVQRNFDCRMTRIRGSVDAINPPTIAVRPRHFYSATDFHSPSYPKRVRLGHMG